MTRSLDIYLHQVRAAHVIQGPGGSLTLEYSPEYVAHDGPALSLALPVRALPYTNKASKVFLEGLIPESEPARERLAQELGISARNAFAILEHIGLDCAGAIQLVPSGTALPRSTSKSEVTTADIAQRLRQMRTRSQPSWVLPNESWSLGGAQAKFALTRINGTWFHTNGSLASTHIFKPGILDMHYQALNEHLCLQAAATLGLQVAQSSIEEFSGEQAIVVQRYDRVITGNKILRIHQEDLCQAMGYLPTKKYESQGGPTATDIIKFLRRISTPEVAQLNTDRFVQALIFNALIGAPDAHAKNYSLLYPDGRTPVLAPLYDIASALAYSETTAETAIPEGRHWVADTQKSAMKIGGAAKFSSITGNRWREFAQANKLDEQQVIGWVHSYCLAIPLAFEIACAQQTATGLSELQDNLLEPIRQLCSQIYDTL